MKCLVIGYGSIGARHVRVLAELGHQVEVVSARALDTVVRHATIPAALTAAGSAGFEYAVIANATAAHRSALAELAEAGFAGRVLVEKPVFSAPAEPGPLPFASCHVAYNLRFHPGLIRLRALVAGQSCLSALVYAGQYLPDWRPGTDYRASYSVRQADGGGVLRDLSHELDYLALMFGPWLRLSAQGGHYSPLAGDSDDIFTLQLEQRDCPIVQLQLNYLDRRGRRFILINTADHTIEIDLVRGVLRCDGDEEAFEIERDVTYRAMHQSVLAGDAAACTMAEALDVLKLIAAAETAARDGTVQWQARTR